MYGSLVELPAGPDFPSDWRKKVYKKDGKFVDKWTLWIDPEGKKYDTKEKARTKLSSKESTSLFHCEICSLDFSLKSDHEDHIKYHKDDKNQSKEDKYVECDICSQQLRGSNRKHNLRRHKENVHNKIESSEIVLDTVIKTEIQLEPFIKSENKTDDALQQNPSPTSGDGKTCNICFKVLSGHNLARHIKSVHKNDGTFRNKVAVKHNSIINANVETYEPTKEEEKDQNISDASKRNYDCSFCENSFRKERTLKLHIREDHSKVAAATDEDKQGQIAETENVKQKKFVNLDIVTEFYNKIATKIKSQAEQNLSNTALKPLTEKNKTEFKSNKLGTKTQVKKEKEESLSISTNAVQSKAEGISKPKGKRKSEENIDPEINQKKLKEQLNQNKLTGYKCSDCDKVLSTKRNLQLHSSVHSGSLPAKCDICGKGFISKWNKNNHIRNVHKIVDSVE